MSHNVRHTRRAASACHRARKLIPMQVLWLSDFQSNEGTTLAWSSKPFSVQGSENLQFNSLPQRVCFVVRRFISFIISYRHNLAISFINNFILALFAIILLGFSLLSTPNLSVKAIPFPVIINFLPSILEPLIYQAVYH